MAYNSIAMYAYGFLSILVGIGYLKANFAFHQFLTVLIYMSVK